MHYRLSTECSTGFCYITNVNDFFSYLNIKIKDGDAHNIICPAIDCNILVPVEFIESKVSTNMAKRYLQFDIKVCFVKISYTVLLMTHRRLYAQVYK